MSTSVRLLLLGSLALGLTPAASRAQTPPPSVTIAADDVHAKGGIKCEGCHSKPGPNQFAKVPATEMAAVCAQCHVREAEFYAKSPKKAIFEKIQMPACVTCHTSHAVRRPADNWIGFKEPAVCMACHVEGAKGAPVIQAYQQHLGQLGDAIARADGLLGRAELAGMLVDDGRSALRGAKEQQVLARVAVHAFNEVPLGQAATEGVAAAAKAEAVGTGALAELRFRRQGLAVATLLIMGFLLTLWMKIRRLPAITD